MFLSHNVSIEVYNTCIQLIGYEVNDCPEVQEMFSVFDKTLNQYTNKAMWYDAKNKILTLPRSMDIAWLADKLNTAPNFHTSWDPYDDGLQINLKYQPRNETQLKAIKFILGKDEYADTARFTQLGVNLNTGAGKTFVTIFSSAYFGMRSIMITSSTGWIEQWKDRILEYTDTKPSEIYIITGRTSIAMILNGMVDISKIKYFLASHQTIHAYATENGKSEDWTKITELFKKLRVGLKIYDEAHLLFDDIWKTDFYTNTRKTLYLTATPARSDRGEDAVYQETFRCMPKIDLFNEETDPHTRYVSVLFNSHPTPGQQRWCTNRYGFDRNKYCSFITTKQGKDYLFKIITILMEIIISTNSKTLIYIGTNAAIKIVYDYIVANYPYMSNNIGIYTSIEKNKFIKEQQLDKMIILSTTKSCGAAIDIKGLKMTVVLAEPFKSKVLARQSLGRTRDSDTTYMEFVDIGFDACKGCYESKKSIFEKYATSVEETYFSKFVWDDDNGKYIIDDSVLEENYQAALQAKNERESRMR